ncbi:hypothetical protein [Rothia sp. (in: high G+C Gram-positive bacteria)]|uniref:hypothetical protein n=1 Tax=Rothia sp. (in: high G+C Gram-positive bacteria) TaxID=1885016 RepID=UPI000EC13A1D|nr:hypothetical protein [Rothia sp. (in: high G+C Gram-positive bacteria)]
MATNSNKIRNALGNSTASRHRLNASDGSQLRAEEFIKRWCEYRAEMMVVVFVHYDLDAFEEHLVELAA